VSQLVSRRTQEGIVLYARWSAGGPLPMGFHYPVHAVLVEKDFRSTVTRGKSLNSESTRNKRLGNKPGFFCTGETLNQFLCGRQIIRAATGIFRGRTVSAQLIESVPVNTIANLTNAGKAGS
jgi:hypothetical protein